MHYRFGSLAALAVSLVACKSDTQANRAADSAVAAKQDSSPAAAPSVVPDSWTMTTRGIGPLRAGMSIAEASKELGGDFKSDSTVGCHEAPLLGAPGKVTATIVDGRVERFDTKDSAILSDLGARVGDSEARVQSLYVGRVTVQPHKYLEKGHYLVVTPSAPADSNTRMIFETDGVKVLEYRAGLLPTVSFVEHCG